MGKKRGILKYQMWQDVLGTLGMTVFLYSISIGVYALGYSSDVVSMGFTPVFCVEFAYSTNQSYMKYDKYIAFGFCRKKFYKEQVIISLFRAVIISAFQTAVQTVYYAEFAQMFAGGVEETLNTYHPIPAIELFFINFCMLTLLHLLFLINSTGTHNFMFRFAHNGKSPQLSQRIQKKKENPLIFRVFFSTVYVVVSAIVLFLCAMVLSTYYQRVISFRFLERMAYIAVIIVINIAMYFVGRLRFRPKYI